MIFYRFFDKAHLFRRAYRYADKVFDSRHVEMPDENAGVLYAAVNFFSRHGRVRGKDEVRKGGNCVPAVRLQEG